MFTTHAEEKRYNNTSNNLDSSFQCKAEIYSEKDNVVTDVICAYL